MSLQLTAELENLTQALTDAYGSDVSSRIFELKDAKTPVDKLLALRWGIAKKPDLSNPLPRGRQAAIDQLRAELKQIHGHDIAPSIFEGLESNSPLLRETALLQAVKAARKNRPAPSPAPARATTGNDSRQQWEIDALNKGVPQSAIDTVKRGAAEVKRRENLEKSLRRIPSERIAEARADEEKEKNPVYLKFPHLKKK